MFRVHMHWVVCVSAPDARTLKTNRADEPLCGQVSLQAVECTGTMLDRKCGEHPSVSTAPSDEGPLPSWRVEQQMLFYTSNL